MGSSVRLLHPRWHYFSETFGKDLAMRFLGLTPIRAGKGASEACHLLPLYRAHVK